MSDDANWEERAVAGAELVMAVDSGFASLERLVTWYFRVKEWRQARRQAKAADLESAVGLKAAPASPESRWKRLRSYSFSLKGTRKIRFAAAGSGAVVAVGGGDGAGDGPVVVAPSPPGGGSSGGQAAPTPGAAGAAAEAPAPPGGGGAGGVGGRVGGSGGGVGGNGGGGRACVS